MLKAVIIGCFCAALLVKGQDGPPPVPPPPGDAPPMPLEHSRVARQTMPMPGEMPGMPNMQGGNPGNLAMQGLGNIPDPTALIAKAQEIGRQFLNGRRRRRSPIVNPPRF